MTVGGSVDPYAKLLSINNLNYAYEIGMVIGYGE
jgi:hypothetical protein